MFFKSDLTARLLLLLLLGFAFKNQLAAAGPPPLDLLSTAHFTILAGAGITTTGGGVINGDVGASPIAGSAIGVTCAQVNGIIYAVDASGPSCAINDATLLTAAKGDLTTAYNDAAGRTPIPSGPNLNPGSGNIGGLNLAPGLYKFTTTALITGSDLTLTGGPDDVWIFQCAADLQLGSGIKVILAGGAQAKNIFWQVGTSAVLDTFSVMQGTILADQSITMKTSSTLVGRALAFSAGVVYNGTASILPVSGIMIQQPAGTNLIDGTSSNYFGSVIVGTNVSRTFTITNSGTSVITSLGVTIDGTNAEMFSVTTNPVVPLDPGSNTTFTVRFAPTGGGLKNALLHVTNNDLNQDPFDIMIAGTGIALISAPEIAIEQPAGTNLIDGGSTNDFGPVALGNSVDLTFTITNLGGAALIISGINIDGTDLTQFSVIALPAFPVAPGSSATFTIQFTPDSPGLKTAALHVTSNDSDEDPFDIMITGTGVGLGGNPEIAVQQPPGTDLPDGGSRDFGLVVVGTNSSFTFTVTNLGNASLIGLGIIIDGADAAMFTVTTNFVGPEVPNGSATFTIQFVPGSTGGKTAALHLANNDSDENPFDITLTGTGTSPGIFAPEIAVQHPPGIDLIDGGADDFGLVLVGNRSSLTFIVTNLGNADLTGLVITIDGANAAMFNVTTNPIAPVVPGGSTTFTVQFTPDSAGLKAAALHLANNDSNENPFDLTLTGTGAVIGIATNILVVEVPPITLNPQTGLFEQTVRLINAGTDTVMSLRLLITGLPVDVRVYNASGTTNGTPFVQYGPALAPGATVDLLIEYYRPNRQAIPPPVFVVETATLVSVTETGAIIQINRSLQLEGGRFLVEFSAVPGRRYALQYSSNMLNWVTAIPILTAPANRVQWYDDGPPKTDSKPLVSGSRFYRVMLLP